MAGPENPRFHDSVQGNDSKGETGEHSVQRAIKRTAPTGHETHGGIRISPDRRNGGRLWIMACSCIVVKGGRERSYVGFFN